MLLLVMVMVMMMVVWRQSDLGLKMTTMMMIQTKPTHHCHGLIASQQTDSPIMKLFCRLRDKQTDSPTMKVFCRLRDKQTN